MKLPAHSDLRTLLWAILLIAIPGAAFAEDWPQWRGRDRAGVWHEDGILSRFPSSGLTTTWSVPLGEGYAGAAVAGGRVFVTDFVREKNLAGKERALCLDEQTGELLWRREWSVDYSGTEPTWANGPRATPTFFDGTVYLMGGMGRLLALKAGSGEVRWQRDLVEDYAAVIPTWGVASAPLVRGDLVIALVGGADGAGVLAFDRLSGQERWRSLQFPGDPGYAPPIVIDAGGRPQLIVWHPTAVSALDPDTGAVLWEHPHQVRMAMTVATPVFDGRRLLLSSFFDGSLLLELNRNEASARPLWYVKGESEQPADTRGLHALITTPVIDGDSIYGIGSYGELRGLDADDGSRRWESLDAVGERARWAAALIVRHGDRYFINNDAGELVIARLTPDGYKEIDRTTLIEPTSRGGGRRKIPAVLWSHPAYANRHIVVRNDREIRRASLALAPAPDEGDETPRGTRNPRSFPKKKKKSAEDPAQEGGVTTRQ